MNPPVPDFSHFSALALVVSLEPQLNVLGIFQVGFHTRLYLIDDLRPPLLNVLLVSIAWRIDDRKPELRVVLI